ncbi:DNA polymerase III subunit delta' [Xylophilus ampelinus]|uniref:DNA polymerase-3 subunit delta n=1 Tax=Xylophilus ampelinus TaxID=54067 RepID=A0A318SN95_9BURK|nr:DNA polymerase III subunit delta' [Xylophilus ampelinus]MCS4509710.1 DNA polymerase III subunit delta' [Xylophilus ampelinus]PYE78762.1 DNA polymerase-3 subunit delta' [Xylophilus ampelinus]
MSTAAPLAPWLGRQLRSLLSQRGHARLLQGPSGLGQYPLGLALARAWLCDTPQAGGVACGGCASCHAIDVRTHADLQVLMPEVQMQALDWPLPEKAQAELDDKKRKPSREIRVEAMREAVEFAQRTDARGRGKVVLVYPAEQMNGIAANALLKTLEEPTGDVRFVLASEAAHQLLPTIRSRCQAYGMAWPADDEMQAWLIEQGVPAADAPDLLRAAGGRPDDALDALRSGRDARRWALLPTALVRGEAAVLADWPARDAIDALQKLCHDLMVVQAGAAPRYFDARSLPKPPPARALAVWAQALKKALRTADHPFNAGLMHEALVSTAQNALNSHAIPP